jgi:hypothetical protein
LTFVQHAQLHIQWRKLWSPASLGLGVRPRKTGDPRGMKKEALPLVWKHGAGMQGLASVHKYRRICDLCKELGIDPRDS